MFSAPAHPASVDKRTLQEQTALLLAVSSEHLSCVQCLLDAGADPDISSKNKETPLYKGVAVLYTKRTIRKITTQVNCLPDDPSVSVACELDNMDMVSCLLSHGATVNQRCGQGWTALHEAVSRNNTDICEVLIRAGAAINPPNTYSVTPLIVAAQRGQTGALCYLIGKGTYLQTNIYIYITPFSVSDLILKSQPCFSAGADVNMQTCDGVTALHEASKNGHKESVALLLTKHADANKPTNSGLLPLHIAAQFGHHE